MAAKGVITGLYLSGQPVQIKDCNVAITQPKIKDIVIFGEDEFLVGVNILGHPDRVMKDARKGNPELAPFSDFQLLLTMLKAEPIIGESINNLLTLIFPEYRVEIEESSIDFYITQEEKEFICGRITSFNFESFSNVINDLFEPSSLDKEPEYNPANDAAAEIAEKIKRGREKKRELNAAKEGPQSLFGRYASILSIGLQMDIGVFYDYTPFQLYDAFNRYFAKVNSDLYTKVSTTPLMDVSQMEAPEEWVRNLY